jgi:hypothetical protein
LGGLVSQQLSDLSGREFTSIAIYRRPQLFVYPPQLPMFNQQEGVKLPKFVVQLNSNAVLYGFYIEKSDEHMSSDWYWPCFLKLLSEHEWHDWLEQAIRKSGLSWILRFEEKVQETGSYRLSKDAIISSFGKGSQFATFSDFVLYLSELPAQQWCNLFLAKMMDKQKAIELREKVSRPISDTFNELVPFFAELLTCSSVGADSN